jgi:hypothetical protein
MDAKDYKKLSPENRLAAITDILATAVLRSMDGNTPDHTNPQHADISAKTNREGLALLGKQSVHG